MRRAARVDSNHLDICHALRKGGLSVISTAAIGKGFPDVVVGFRGFNHLVEIKDGTKSWRMTPDQITFFDEWKGGIVVISSIESAIEWMEELRK